MNEKIKNEAVEFKDGYAVGWKICVPECFKDSIKSKTFSVGDVFYDSPEAYEKIWIEALQNIQLVIQIQSFSPSNVIYTLSTPNKDKTAIEKIATEAATADDFMNFLRYGSSIHGTYYSLVHSERR